MKAFLSAFLVLLACSFSTLAAPAQPERQPLIMVMGEDSFPFQFLDDEGQPAGLLVDFWREWGRITGQPLVFVARHWQDSLDQLAKGKADIHIGMAQTPQREALFDFIAPVSEVNTYLYLHQELTARKQLNQLLPFQIGIVSGSSHEPELKAQVPGLQFRYFPSREDLLGAALAGELAVFAGMDGYLRDQQQQEQLMTLFPVANRLLIKQTKIHPAINKQKPQLKKLIEDGIAAMDPDFIRINERRWLGFQRHQAGLAIAMQVGVEPFVDIGLDGQPHGLYVDMWRLWSQKTGIGINFIPGDMNRSLEDVRRGVADAHIGYPESDEMRTGLERAAHLYTVKSRLFMYQKELGSEQQLAGQRIGVVPTAPYLAELKQRLPNTSLRFYDSMAAMVEGARKGDIAGFVAAAAWTQHSLLQSKRWSEFYQYPDMEFNTEIYVLTRKEDPGLTQRIARGFQSLGWQEKSAVEHKWMLNSQDHVFGVEKQQLPLSSDDRDMLAKLPELRMGYLADWPPMEFQDEKGQFAGINSDIAKRFEAQLGIKIKPVMFKEWHSLFDALRRGEVDMAGSVAKMPEREGSLLYTDPYWPSPWALVSPVQQVSVFNLDQLAGQRLAVVEGYQLVARLTAEQPGIRLVLVPDTRAGLDAVQAGKADVFIDKVVTLASALRSSEYSQLKMSLLADLAEQKSHVGVALGFEPLVPLLNASLATLDKATQQRIHDRWVPLTIDTGAARYQRWLQIFLVAGAVLLLITVAVVIVNRRLNREVEARQKAEARIAHLASHDNLTKLPNRSLLDDRLNQALLQHGREQQRFALMFLDLDGFKDVNDSFGHAEGDKLLVKVAQILSETIRKSDTVARFGGDEFVILLNRITDLDSVCEVAENLVARLAKPIALGNRQVQISVSLGLALYPEDGDNAISLMQKADKLMYHAKRSGGNGYRVG
ncbi:diguanylate cyclase domain-containing protein [Shewanella cyperi]|uniref:diguanylate cyclase domain-containing protein n=1 Tax=Shewanella cyperi TaxID=2814292 RepID=UPI002B1BE3F5|nr:transporter substrate-binding domain-containing protein [Shewanella cyperi]